jgi:diguanylate cyclase (GGDEF)-like protein
MEVARSQLHYAARNRQGCFVILSDVDCFRSILDAYGRGAGDAVLIGVAERIKEIIRPYDLFARHDGGEFIMLAVDANRKGVEGLVSRMRLGLCEAPVMFNGTPISISASFGLARIAPGASLEDAIAHADEALYTAKSEGRNRSVCHEEPTAPDQASPKHKTPRASGRHAARRKSSVRCPVGTPGF